MKAGRELDALVAEKVMGWVKPRPEWVVSTPDSPWVNPNDGLGYRPDEIPHYSTDIAAAWELVEKFSFFTLEWDGLNHRAVVHALQMKTDTRPPASAIEDTAPLAICLAALRACGVEL